MKVIFCAPKLTMKNTEKANEFFDECKEIMDTYIVDKSYICNDYLIDMLLGNESKKDDIFIFFNSETGVYQEKFETVPRIV